MKLSDEKRKAMFARLNKEVKEQNYDGLKRWHEDNKRMYGNDIADNKLYRKFQFKDRKIKEHGSRENWINAEKDKGFERHRKRTIARQEKADKKYKDRITEKYGSMKNYLDKMTERDRVQGEKIKAVQDSPQLAKANRNYALTGSKYYKQDMANTENPDAPYLDSIHCANCSQRLGNSITPCPLCKDRSLNHIYGYMLSHPNDPRWLLPKYNNSKFTPNENLHAESSLNERRSNGGNLDSLR